MKRISLLQLGLLVAITPACADDVSSSTDTESSGSSDTTASDTTATATATITTTSMTDASSSDTTDGTDTTGDTDPTSDTDDTDTTGDDTDTDTDSDTDTDTDTDTTGGQAVCGDGVAEGDEACDGDDLAEAACPVLGTIACNDDCTLDESECTDTLSMCNTPGTAIDGSTDEDAPIIDTITIADDLYVADVNVPLDITHTWVSDLRARVISPNTDVDAVLLDGGRCSLADDIAATFDDDGVEPDCGTPAFSGDVTPVTSLASFIGVDAMGDWQLELWDASSSLDDGTLNEWCLEITLSADDPVMCNDGVAQFGEVCDTDDLGGLTCTDFDGFVGGALGCADDCTFDTSMCLAPGCGNGILEDGEECDGDALDGTVCEDLPGFASGTLACADDCTFDTSSCNPPMCGNGVLEEGEDCDGAEFGDAICDDFEGYLGGTLTCADDCSIDETSCDAAPQGDWCGDAFVVDAASLPYTDSGDTLSFSNDYGYSSGACPGEGSGWNSGSEDVVYEFTPAVTGSYTIQFDAAWDSTVYAVTDCSDIDASCVGGAENGNPETIVGNFDAGTTYFIIGGHYSNTTPGSGGAYTLTVSDVCTPSCDEVTCGEDDGCGGTCGCADGDFCNVDTCETAADGGDTCGDPRIIPADGLPYTDTSHTTLYGNDYGYSAGSCDQFLAGNGEAADIAYAFTPDADGDYQFVFDADFDSTIYLVTDCGDVDSTCVAGSDSGNPETISATLVAGTTYYLIAGPWSGSSDGGLFTLTATAL